MTSIPPHQIDFSALVLGFSSAALSYLGIGAEENGVGTNSVNLELAKQNIDIIALLKEKTQGNLLPEESKLIEGVLTDLRLKFVDVQKSQKKS